MAILRYDEPGNVSKLRQVSPRSRVAFALATATRLLPAYRRFHLITGRGEPAKLDSIASRLWRDVAGESMSPEEIETALATAMELIPREADGWAETQPYAEDAAAALAYALRARLTGDPQEAAWAGRRAYESVDHFVTARARQRPGFVQDEVSYLSDPLVQAELRRQQRDLQEICELEIEDPKGPGLLALRERSTLEAETFFGESH